MDVNYDYNSAFKSISLKLRKRFLRKPNLSEAIDEYTSLSRLLDSEEYPSGLAAYCLQQVARCHHSVGNTSLESGALQAAARRYLTAHIVATVETRCVSLDEDLMSALSVYDECIRVHCDAGERHLAGKLCVEIADLLATRFEKHFEAIPYYERALVLFTDPGFIANSSSTSTGSSNTSVNNSSTAPLSTPLTASNANIQAILISIKLAVIKVFTCDYSGALNIYTDICSCIQSKCIVQPSPSSQNPSLSKSGPSNSTLSGVPSSSAQTSSQQHQITYNKPIGLMSRLLVDADISKLLLLIYLKPNKMRQEQTQTLEFYSWFQALSSPTQYLPAICMSRDLFIMLQSFVMACQSNDLLSLKTLHAELVDLLDPHERQTHVYLLDLIVAQLLNSSYTDDLLSQ